MSENIKNTKILLLSIAVMVSGCTHYAAFPEVGEEGVLTADEANVAYDDSREEKAKKALAQKPQEKVIKNKEKQEKTSRKEPENKDKKAKNTKDLTIPDAEVVGEEVSYVVPNKTTPVVITDIDLKEMDAEDSYVKVIKPTVKTKTIIATKKIQKVLPQKVSTKEPTVFYLAETVYFGDGKATVDNKYSKKLKEIVREAKAHNGKIIVQGFASSRTRNTDIITHKKANLKVSIARADNIAALLIKYGMPKSRIITEGLSDSRPAYQEVMPEGERLNRRAEVYISY